MQLQKDLCQRFCPHFKSSKEDEISCLGFLVVKKLIRQGIAIPLDEKLSQHAYPEIQTELMSTLCPPCPFFQEDCDFARQKENALPCGGFLLLWDLIGKKIISIDIVKEIR